MPCPSERSGRGVIEMPEAGPDDGLIHVGAGTVRRRVRGGTWGPRSTPPLARPLKYSRWRAMALASVYVLFGLHIAHWKLNGSTLAPLELNEVMYTLEAGVVTAGFLLMATLFLATALVGRFFCSWACHILALEDLCAWLLERARIRPWPVRSRLLLLMPTVTMLYMFVWPQVLRIYEGRAAPRLRILADEDGWASFVTDDFWRNLPDPWIAGLTFAVCGFAVIYFLGSRSFCLHACPYGALFAAADRIAPGRIKLIGDCRQCGICTAVCSSHVRVHEEIARFGKVVDTSCMKDLDCVSACPEQAIRFGFTRPAGFDSFSRTGRRGLKYDFTPVEELLMAATFLSVLVVFRGLYTAIPFLMTLGMAGIAGYLAIVCLRLVRRPDVRLIPFRLKRAGKLTGSGWVFGAAMIVFELFFTHSVYIRYHEVLGQRAFDSVRLAVDQGDATLPAHAVRSAIHHLTVARQWGLFRPQVRDQQLASLHLKSTAPGLAEPYLRRIVLAEPRDTDSRLALAQLLAQSGRTKEAEEEEIIAYRTAVVVDAANVSARMTLGRLLAESGRYREAAATFREVVSLRPDLVVAHYNLAAALQNGGDERGAIEAYEETLVLLSDDVQTLVNLGFLLAESGELAAAAGYFERAVELQPDHAQAHFNLAAIRHKQGDLERADEHYHRAAELDPRYATKIRQSSGGHTAISTSASDRSRDEP